MWQAWSNARRAAVVGAVISVLLVTPVLVAAAALRWEYSGNPSADTRTRGRDAYWLGHAWVDGRKTDADVAGLAAQLSGTGIKDLYVHTGPLSDDGSLPTGLAPRARWFTGAAHRLLPGVRVQAWLGDFVAPERDALHMENSTTRNRVVASVHQVLDLGYDGVHFDLEPIRSGSVAYLALLEQTRASTVRRHAVLSVSAPQIDPLPGLHHIGIAVADHGKFWAQDYFVKVAHRVDQIAVMSYDTAMPTEWLYGGYVAQQTTLALDVTPPTVDLLMGVPMFWAQDYGHHGDAETPAAAIRGIRLAVDRAKDRPAFGVALYVDFTAEPRDFDTYRRDWGGRR